MLKSQFQKNKNHSPSPAYRHQIKDIWKMIEIPTQFFIKLLLPCTQSATYALINLMKM